MNNYLPYIFGISSLLIGIYLFLISFGIYKPKKKNDSEEKSENYKAIMKIISIILILRGGYNLLDPNPKRYQISQNNNVSNVENNTEWKSESRNILIQKCIIESGTMAKIYPSIMKEYAECTTDIIMTAFSQKEYLEISNKSLKEQEKVLIPLIKDCLDEMDKKIDSVNQNKKNNR